MFVAGLSWSSLTLSLAAASLAAGSEEEAAEAAEGAVTTSGADPPSMWPWPLKALRAA